MSKQFYITTTEMNVNNSTKFKLNDRIFYIYCDTRKKNSTILYTKTLKSLIKVIFLQSLGYDIQIPKGCPSSQLFPSIASTYCSCLENNNLYSVLYKGGKLYYLESTTPNDKFVPIDIKIFRTLPIEAILSRFDYAFFEKYLKKTHSVTNVNVMGKIILDELEEWYKLAREVGEKRAFEEFFYIEYEHLVNYLLLMQYLSKM